MRNRSIVIIEAEQERDAARAMRDIAEARLAGVLDALAELVKWTRHYNEQQMRPSNGATPLRFALSHAEAMLAANGRKAGEG